MSDQLHHSSSRFDLDAEPMSATDGLRPAESRSRRGTTGPATTLGSHREPETPGGAPPMALAYGNYGGGGGGYGGYGAYGGNNEIHLTQYLRMLYKRRWAAVAAFIVVFTSTMVYT